MAMAATRVAGALMTLAIGAFLFLDANTFVLMAADPATGRPKGCFTAVELMLGVSESSGIRGIEWLVSIGLLLAVPVMAISALVRWFRRR